MKLTKGKFSIMQRVIMLTLYIISMAWLAGCNHNGNISRQSSIDCKVDTLSISYNMTFYDSAINTLPSPHFVILKENDATMYSEISRVIDANGKYFILDAWGARKLISFDHDGNPITCYGRRGNGPGEYITSDYCDVDSTAVYLLNNAGKQLLTYDLSGNFIKKSEMPFYANAFCRLNNGNFMFNLLPNEENTYQICITDSNLTAKKFILKYPKGCVGGFLNNDIIRKNGNCITYYSSPSDTIYHFDLIGNMTGKTVLDFEDGAIDNLAKINYVKAREEGLIEKHGMQYYDSPLITSNGLIFGTVKNRGNYYYSCNDTKTKRHGLKKFGANMSAYSVVTPLNIDSEGHIIGVLSPEILRYLDDADTLPDSVKNVLDDGCKVLQIFR